MIGRNSRVRGRSKGGSFSALRLPQPSPKKGRHYTWAFAPCRMVSGCTDRGMRQGGRRALSGQSLTSAFFMKNACFLMFWDASDSHVSCSLLSEAVSAWSRQRQRPRGTPDVRKRPL